MIENAGCGVAMGNSAPYVKEVSNLVVANNNEDGVAEDIEKIKSFGDEQFVFSSEEHTSALQSH